MRSLQFERFERRDLLSADAWPHGEGLAADLFNDGGAYLSSSISLSREMSMLDWTSERLSTSSSTLTKATIGGNANDLNGALLFPDGQPRVGVLYVNGGASGTHGGALGASGRQAIRDFVAAGGSYTGSCAGAFLIDDYSSRILNVWHGRMGATGSGSQTVSFAETPDHPIAQFLAKNGVEDLRVDYIPQIGGPIFYSNRSDNPEGSEFLGKIVGSSVGTTGRDYILDYPDPEGGGHWVVQTGHTEYGRRSEHTVLNAAIYAYARSVAELEPDVKGAIESTVTMTGPTEKVGDGQYHRYGLTVEPGTRELRISTDNAAGTEVFVTLNGVAYQGGSDYSGDAITIQNPAAGTWEVSILGTHEVKNGVAYTLTIDATMNPLGPVWMDVPITPGLNLHQNPIERRDVNGDGMVSPLDALILINAINERGMGPLPAIHMWPMICLDVDGDGDLLLGDVVDVLFSLI